MPATRKPYDQLALNGTLSRNPKRYQARGPAPQADGELGPAPKHLTPAQASVWTELQAHLHPGTTASQDRISYETMVVLIAEMRELGSAFKSAKLAQLIRLLASFGLDPVNRARLPPPKPAERRSRFLELMASAPKRR